MRRVIYTAIYGDDLPLKLWDPLIIPDRTDFICFTDQLVESTIWEVRREDLVEHPRLAARTVKVLSHAYFPDAVETLWMDSRFQLVDNIFFYSPPNEVVAFEHPDRENLVDEAREIVRLGRADEEAIDAQLADYLSDGFGSAETMKRLTATGFLLRKNTRKVAHFNEVWMDEIKRHTLRDQMSVDFAARCTGVKIHYLPGSYRDNGFAKWTK